MKICWADIVHLFGSYMPLLVVLGTAIQAHLGFRLVYLVDGLIREPYAHFMANFN